MQERIDNILKESLRFPLTFLVVAIVWQLIFYQEIRWVDNIGISFMIFLLILIYNWSKKSYKWNKDNGN
ncbi:hypothetical protein [Oceanobacillus sp. CAU 1775]